MISKKILSILTAIAALLLLAACSMSVTRNSDGSLSVTTSITGDSLNSEIKAAIADPLIQSIQVDLQSGFMNVTGTRKRLDSDKLDSMSFRLDLGVSNGQLTATVSNALIDGVAVGADRVANWNQTIANRLENIGRRRANSTLQSVAISSAGVTLTWRVETARSRGQ